MAAVSYHFGSLKTLYDAAVEDALERYLDAQHKAVRSLGPPARGSGGELCRPMIRALAAGGRDLEVIRIVARAGIDPPQDGIGSKPGSSDSAGALGVFKANVRGVREPELIFRTRCVSRDVELAVLAPLGGDLRNKSREADRATSRSRSSRARSAAPASPDLPSSSPRAKFKQSLELTGRETMATTQSDPARTGPSGAKHRTRARLADPKAREFLRGADPVMAGLIDAHPDFRLARGWISFPRSMRSER